MKSNVYMYCTLLTHQTDSTRPRSPTSAYTIPYLHLHVSLYKSLPDHENIIYMHFTQITAPELFDRLRTQQRYNH